MLVISIIILYLRRVSTDVDMWRSNGPAHKYKVNTPAIISQVQTTHKEARKNKTASKLFKMFLIMLLVLSLSMMIQSAPAETEKESRQIRCFFECPAYVYGPVCGVENNTFPNTCFLECHGEQLACDGECPCPNRGPNKAPNRSPNRRRKVKFVEDLMEMEYVEEMKFIKT